MVAQQLADADALIVWIDRLNRKAGVERRAESEVGEIAIRMAGGDDGVRADDPAERVGRRVVEHHLELRRPRTGEAEPARLVESVRQTPRWRRQREIRNAARVRVAERDRVARSGAVRAAFAEPAEEAVPVRASMSSARA